MVGYRLLCGSPCYAGLVPITVVDWLLGLLGWVLVVAQREYNTWWRNKQHCFQLFPIVSNCLFIFTYNCHTTMAEQQQELELDDEFEEFSVEGMLLVCILLFIVHNLNHHIPSRNRLDSKETESSRCIALASGLGHR